MMGIKRSHFESYVSGGLGGELSMTLFNFDRSYILICVVCFFFTLELPDIMALKSKFAESAIDAGHDAVEDVHGILLDPTEKKERNSRKGYEINCRSWLCVAS